MLGSVDVGRVTGGGAVAVRRAALLCGPVGNRLAASDGRSEGVA